MWRIEYPLENRNGTLFIGGASTLELAEKYGTPLYVIDENRIRDNYRRLRDAFQKHYSKFRLYYAVKANNNLSVLRILEQEGAGADCSNPNEIYFALLAGFRKDRILYTGNYNSDEELKYACDAGVTVNLDDVSAMDRLAEFSSPPEVPPAICFRFNPGIGKGGVEGLIFAGPDAKFGVLGDKIIEAYKKAKEYGFNKFGIHMMTGSNVRDEKYFVQVAEKLFDTAGKISEEVGIEFEFINVGGGFGVPYKPGEKDLDIESVAAGVVEKFREKISEHGMREPTLLIEPGRYIVCDASVLLTRVHAIKNSHKKFVGVDAGMNTLLRPALYDAYHEILVANKLNEHEKEKVNVVGPICENTDQFAKDRELPKIAEGDLLAVLNAGAYGYSMSSQYNTRPRPAEVLVKDGAPEFVRERENVVDLIGRQKIPARLLK
jgi:diaminopimelate decarboxylase